MKSHSFGTLLPKTVDFADFRSLFIKAHSFGHSLFGRLPGDFWRILLGSSENGRDPRLRKPSAPEAGSRLKDPRKHCFVNERFQKHSKKQWYFADSFLLGLA